nr:MAG TPA: Protein of unknown function (DUF1441) [Caudoviricetes sp.]
MAEKKAPRARVTEEIKFIFTTADTCEFFQISRETLSTWQKKGAPKAGRGKWNIKALMEWRFDGKHTDSPEVRKLKAEADLKEAKAAQEKIKLSVKKDEFVNVFVVRSELTRLLANLKKNLLAMGHQVASNLAFLDMEAAELAKSEVDKRVKEVLTEMAEGRLYRGRTKKKEK